MVLHLGHLLLLSSTLKWRPTARYHLLVMDEPSIQIRNELRLAIVDALDSKRPLLHHLNADTSWLLQIPRPANASKRGGRFYFNILIDPWLGGGQSDVAKWFSQQFHATESSVGSIAVVEELLRRMEVLASDVQSGQGKRTSTLNAEEIGRPESLIDAVAISHEFTDHCHKDTLLQVHPDVPVFATDKAAPLIQSWKHFRSVQRTPWFSSENADWHSTSVPPLPEWVGISRLVTKGDTLYYHSALLITFNNGHGSGGEEIASDQVTTYGEAQHLSTKWKRGKPKDEEDDLEGAEAVIYTPHGIHNEDLSLIPAASPPIRTLAFLHGLHDIAIGSQQQLNLGAHNGLKAQRILNARYWISTHDEMKQGGGLISFFLRRKVISIKDALKEEQQVDSKPDHDHDDILDSFKETNWLELANGESRVLL